MKSLIAISSVVLALVTLATSSSTAEEPAAAAAPGYKIIKQWPIGGDTRWDYLSLDVAARKLYIARSSHVSVINVDTGEVLGDLPNTAGVHGAAIAPEQEHGFTSNGKDGTVTMFDLKTIKPLETIKAGSKPDAIVFDPATKTVFAFNGNSSDTTAIDAVTGKVLGTLALKGQPEFSASDEKGTMFVNLEDKNEVVAFDAKKLEVLHRWPLAPGKTPTGMAMDREHRRLFVGCRSQHMIVMDADSGKVIEKLPIGSGVDATAFDPETGLAFASCGDGTLTIIHEDSPDKFTVVETVKTFKGAKTMTLDTKTHNVIVAAVPPATTSQPSQFTVLVIGK